MSRKRRTEEQIIAVLKEAHAGVRNCAGSNAMDFVHDRLAQGRRFKCFTMSDPCTKEVPVIEADFSIGGSG